MKHQTVLQRCTRALIASSLLAIPLAIPIIVAGSASATLPGSPGRILFASDRDGDYDIWIMNRDGANASALTVNAASDEDPVWSPDGSKIAFASDRDSNDFEIWVMNANGSNPVRLTNSIGDDRAPAWSPDGTQIVFQSTRNGGDWDLMTMTSSGDAETPLTSNDDDDTDPDYSPDGTKIAFASASPGDFEIMVMNASGGAATNVSNAPSSEEYAPSWSPDGASLAFSSDRGEGDEDIYISSASGANPQPLTDNEFTDRYPVWSPDGTSIAYTSDLFFSLFDEILVIDLATRSPTPLSGNAASDIRPDWGVGFELIERVSGNDRIETAIEVSKKAFVGPNSAGAVVLARADNFPDALAGTALAAAKDAPILLTSTASLDARTKAELDRVLATNKTVYLLGGPAALSTDLEAVITGAGYVPVRLGGADRFETAVLIAQTAQSTPGAIFVAQGRNFPDAIVAGAAAAAVDGVVVLADDTTLPAATAAYIAGKAGVTRYAIGGSAAAADTGATPIVGADRYDTSVRVAQQFFPEPEGVTLASGVSFPDGLTGGVLSGARRWPLVLSDPAGLSTVVETYLIANAADIGAGFLYGGPAALGPAVLDAASAAISGA